MKTAHKTAETSINCYHDHIKGWRENSENKIIFEALRRIQPATCRQLAIETGIENSATARTLNNLWFKLKPAPISISHTAPCPISGVRVKWYFIANGQTSLNFNN